MTLNLSSVLAKLGRADEHAQAVKAEIKRWRDSRPYTVTREHNADFTRHSLVAHIGIEPPLLRWTLMVGDAVHNMRAALDHFVYAIAIYEASGQNPPPDERNLLFPICDTCPEFTRTERKRLMSLSDKVREGIEACQPYHRKHPDLPPLLSVLNELEKTDKHKLLRLAFSSTAHVNVGFVGPPIEGMTVEFSANLGEIKNGTEILAYTCSQPAPYHKFDRFDLLIAVTVLHGMGPSGKDRTDTPNLLTLLNKEVRDIIEKISAVALK
jgi:hypothetical protein